VGKKNPTLRMSGDIERERERGEIDSAAGEETARGDS